MCCPSLWHLAYWGGVNSVSATKTYWAPSTAIATWNSGTKTMTWTAGDTNGWHVMNSGLLTGDLLGAGYTKLRVDIESITGDDHILIKIVSTDKSDKYIQLYRGVNNIVFADYSTEVDFSKVTEFSFWGDCDDGSAVITDCYLYNPVKTITVATGFGDEITSMDYITEGNKFVISNGTNALYFEGNQDAKDAAVQSVPNTSYYYYTLTEIKLDLNSDEALETYYAINIVNEAGTAFPAPYSLGNCLNFTGITADAGNALFSGSCQSDKGQGYGTDCQYKGLWEITYSSENGGFALRNVGANKYAIVRGNSGDVTYLKLYKSIVFSSSTDLEKEENAANDAIFALANATGYSAETGILQDGGWTFATPVDLSDWDYLIITTEETQRTDNTYIRIEDNDGKYVEKNGYAPGDQPEMYFSVWNNHNVACISMDYLRKEKGLDISKIKSLAFSGIGLKISSVYLTDYENTKLGPTRGRYSLYVNGDEVRTYTESTVGRFGTICLPYVASCAGAEIYSIASTDGSSISLTKVNGLLEAGKPYFYKASDATGKKDEDVHNVNFFRADLAKYDAASAGTNNGLVGTFSEITLTPNDNYYVLSNNTLYKVDAGATGDKAVKIGANKAYVDISQIVNKSRGAVFLDFDEPTGVNEVRGQKKDVRSDFFNLAGQRVAQPTKGLYIVNGKKVIIK